MTRLTVSCSVALLALAPGSAWAEPTLPSPTPARVALARPTAVGAIAPLALANQAPPALAPPPTYLRRKNGWLYAAGIALDIVGSISLVGGAVVTVADLSSNGMFSGIGTALLGAPLLGLGVLTLAPGIPMTVIGAKHVPVESAPKPSVRLGPGVVSASWSF